MKPAIVFTVSLLSAHVESTTSPGAQETPPAVIDPPDCSLPCIAEFAWRFGCSTHDYPCICPKMQNFGREATNCMIDECGPDQARQAIGSIEHYCYQIMSLSSSLPSTGSPSGTPPPSQDSTPSDSAGGARETGSTDGDDEDSDGGLSVAVQAGLGAGVSIGVIGLLVAAFVLRRRSRKRKASVAATVAAPTASPPPEPSVGELAPEGTPADLKHVPPAYSTSAYPSELHAANPEAQYFEMMGSPVEASAHTANSQSYEKS